MIRRWLPKSPILKRALAGVLICLLCVLLALVADGWNAKGNEWRYTGARTVTDAVQTYGVNSPEAAAAVKQLGEGPQRKDLVALFDVATGKAVAAWPPEFAGRTPEEMVLAGGARLPQLFVLTHRALFGIGSPAGPITVFTSHIFPRFEPGQAFRPRIEVPAVPGTTVVPGNPESGLPQPQALLVIAAPHSGSPVLETLGNILGVVALLGILLYWLSLAWWVYDDARHRGREAFAWGLLALLTNLVGVAVYLVVRRERAGCPQCGTAVERKYDFCPHCGYQLKRTCAHCGHELRSGWKYCASCGAPFGDEEKSV